jgi:hypothetical protein
MEPLFCRARCVSCPEEARREGSPHHLSRSNSNNHYPPAVNINSLRKFSIGKNPYHCWTADFSPQKLQTKISFEKFDDYFLKSQKYGLKPALRKAIVCGTIVFIGCGVGLT